MIKAKYAYFVSALAQGEYILNLDGDDFLHKDTCLKCYELLKTYKNQHSLACGEAQSAHEKYELDFIKTFMHFMIKLLAFHRVGNEVRPFECAYQRHLEQGYAKWLARSIFSLQKKRFGYKQTKREFERFVKENKGVFEKI